MLPFVIRQLFRVTAIAGLLLVVVPSSWLDPLMFEPKYSGALAMTPTFVILLTSALGYQVARGNNAAATRLLFAVVGLMWGAMLYENYAGYAKSLARYGDTFRRNAEVAQEYPSDRNLSQEQLDLRRSARVQAALAEADLATREPFHGTVLWYLTLALSALWLLIGLASPTEAYVRAFAHE